MIQKTHGKACFIVVFLYRWVVARFLFSIGVVTVFQAYKHVFTSPSSVDNQTKATRSGNARIHRMTQVTLASVAYIATQVSIVMVEPYAPLIDTFRSALPFRRHLFSPEQIQLLTRKHFTWAFSTSLMTQKKNMRLINSLLGGTGMLFLEPLWFILPGSLLSSHSQIFPSYLSDRHAVCKDSALARIKKMRVERRAIANCTDSGSRHNNCG